MPRKLVVGLIGTYFALTACTTTPGAVCPAIAPYSAETQHKAADEIRALPADSVLPGMMADYGQLRAKLRVCQ